MQTEKHNSFDMNDVRFRLIKQTLLALIIIGFPALIASLYRSSEFGLKSMMILHISIYTVNVVIYFTIHKFSLRFLIYFLLFSIFTIGFASILSVGISGAGLFILASVCIMSSFLLGKKRGQQTLVITLILLSVVATLIVTNIFIIDIDLNRYLILPSSWIITIIGFTLFVAIIINSSGDIENFLHQAIKSLTKHETQLQELVDKRTTLMEQALDKLDGVLSAATQVAIIATDTDGTVTLFNSGAEEILGYTSEEIVHSKHLTFWHKESEIHEQTQRLSKELGYQVSGFEALVARSRLYQADEREWTLIHKHGNELTVSLSITAIKAPNGDITGFLGCGIDITEKNRINAAFKVNEIRLRNMVDNVPGITYRCKADADWTMSYISPAIQELLGYPVSEFINNSVRTYASVIYPADVNYVDATVHSALHKKQTFHIEYRIVDKSGNIHWVDERGQGIYSDNGQVTWIDGIIIDITLQKQIVNDLKASEARYSSIIENIPNIIMRLSRSGNIEFINRSIGDINKDLAIKKNIIDLIGVEHKSDVDTAITQAIKERQPQSIDATLNISSDGLSWYQLKVGPIIESEQVQSLTLVCTNIDKRVEKEAYIKHLSLHDHLTGLPNRRLFEEKIDFYIKHSARSGSQFALLILDLDNFKPVNDNYGHDFGDQLLKELAVRFNECIRDADIIARLGGDEFAIVITDIKHPNIVDNVCQKVIERINTPFIINSINIQVGISIGVSSFPIDALDALSIVKKADLALYQAKDSGKNQVAYYSNVPH